MASTSPSPNSSPTAVPPASSPPTNSSVNSPPPTVFQPNQTSVTPAPTNPLTPPPQSPPPAVPDAPPPSPPAATPPPTLPPPLLPTSPPPSRPPPTSPPPTLPAAHPPATNSPAPPNLSPPPPLGGSPPQASPAPPVVTPPPPLAVTLTPPPPTEVPLQPSSNPPPPPPAPPAEPSKNTPPPPLLTPQPSGSPPAPTPPTVSSPPPVPSSSLPPISPPGPPSNSSVNGSSPSPLPTFPTEKPTARSTIPGPNITANAASRDAGGLKTGGAVAIGIVVVFLVLSLVVMAAWFTRRRKKKGSDSNGGYIMPSPFASSQNSDSSFLGPQQSIQLAGSVSGSNFMNSPEPGGLGNSRSWFTYKELSVATDRFSATNLLGEGGFGCVYKGFLTDGREVAVKQLKIGSGQGEREFRAEVEIISRVHHRHLVSLLGYCISEHQRLLVYDYVSNNTLHYHLHGEGRPVMDWATRVKVAAGAARGLAYLHEDCHPRIIHRDIKSSNILLDNNFDAQVADFGLAKLALDSNTHVTTRVMGTFEYMAPEYASSDKLTEKSDVFSFGVELLELITGRKPVDASQPLGDESLVEWIKLWFYKKQS